MKSYGAQADLVITQSTETFEKTRQGIQEPAEAMQSDDVQVSDFDNLAVFGQLFPREEKVKATTLRELLPPGSPPLEWC